tara:strand:- start:55708 stop:57219 length:1512 start_codon:yes stop_codon:yes gene_type:complete
MILTLDDSKKFIIINECSELEYDQLKISLTKKIEGYRFHPLVKRKVWDGNISFLKRNKIPAGLWKEVVDICKEYDFEFTLNNITDIFDTKISESDFLDWSNDFFQHSKIKPREYQIDAAIKILKYRRCLAELATSAGKTLISFMIVAYLLEKLKKRKVLMIVPNVSLVLQATGDFEEYNSQKVQLKIQQIYSGVKLKKSSNVVIGTYQSLVKKDAEYFKQFDVVFVDETHKAKAKSIQTIMDKCWHCDYRFGLSGTIPKRGTVNRLTLMSAMGPLVIQVKANDLLEQGFISKCKVLQIQMDYATETQKKAFAELSKGSSFDRKRLFSLEQNFINVHDNRLDFVCKVVKKTDDNSLVLFHKINYGEKLFKKLKQITNKKVYYVDGSTKTSLREEYKSRMEKNHDVIIVASYGTFSTGISIKNIHSIFFTESFKSEVIIRQSIGRGLRKHNTKDTVKIYDFVDDLRYKNVEEKLNWENYIHRHGRERIKIYKEEKFPFEIQKIKF